MLPRGPQLPLLEVEHPSTDTTLVVVAKVSAGLRILEPKVAILLDAEPVGVQLACIARALQFRSIALDGDGSAAMLFDDLESIFWPRDSSGATPERI